MARHTSSFIFLLLLAFLTACSSQTIIVHNLDEREANEILTYLNDHNVPAVKQQAPGAGGAGKAEVKWDIQVAADRANESMALLNAVGLPRRRGENLLGIFTTNALVPSEMQEQIRYQAGLAEQLSSVIRKFDGVIDAEVNLSFPKEDPLNPNLSKNPVTASVYVKHNGVLDDPNSHLESKIRRLVANSVPNLNYDNVTVVGERARYSETGLDLPTSSSANSEKPLVSVWTLIIAKESITRFRVIFFSFFVAILVLLAITGWLCWKILPFVKRPEGIKHLLSLKPFVPEESKKEGSPPESDTNSANPGENDKGSGAGEAGEEAKEKKPPESKR